MNPLGKNYYSLIPRDRGLQALYPFCMRLRSITRSLEGWGYNNKANLRWLNSAHLYKEMVLRTP